MLKKKNKPKSRKSIAATIPRLQFQLCPYQSYHVFKDPTRSDQDRENLLVKILDDATKLTKLDPDEIVVVGERSDPNRVPEAPTGLLLCWQTYTKERPVSWAEINANIRDRENHIIIVAAAHNHISVTTSDKALAGRLDRLKPTSTDVSILSKLLRPSHDSLESALVGGKARTLWMSGIHRDRAIRPNAKVLIGSDLRAALDPLSDQTFHYTSVRSDGPGLFGSATPGVSPRKSRVWLTSSQKFLDFTTRTQALLKAIESSTVPKSPPFPILARPVNDISNVKGAFDFALLPPEAQQASNDQDASDFDCTTNVEWSLTPNPKSSDVTLSAKHEGRNYKVKITFSATSGATVDRLEPTPASLKDEDLHKDIQASLRYFDSDSLRIYFDSNHTYSSRSMFEISTRPVPFKCETENFKGIDIKKEKPQRVNGKTTTLALDLIGNSSDDSLFSWLYHRQKTGWLWCDDSPGEIADFIHIAKDGTVTLFHLKGANSDAGGVSVGAYEVVCAQALKNIRMLDPRDMIPVIESRINTPLHHNRCWYNGKVKSEKDFLNRLKAVNISTPKVVVIQPHVSYGRLPKTEIDLAKKTPEAYRARQLHTMLNGFAASFRNLGITFEVIVKK